MSNTKKLIIFFGNCFSVAVKAPAIVVDISVGPISSNGESGPMLPPIDRSTFLLYDETGWNDAIVYGAALKLKTASRLYPVLGLRFARRDVWTKGGFRRNWQGHSSGG